VHCINHNSVLEFMEAEEFGLFLGSFLARDTNAMETGATNAEIL
jgi:hypothetical protein